MSVCFCWRTGIIGFGPRAPKGSLRLAEAPLRQLRPIVCAIARHSYDGTTLTVPGIPEADRDKDALSAAVRFSKALKKRLSHPFSMVEVAP